VTWWRHLPQHGPVLRAGDLAGPLLRLHALRPPPFDLPRWDPVGASRARIMACATLGADERRALLGLVRTAVDELGRIRYALPAGVIHNDAYIGNLLRGRDGAPVLCDLDGLCHGPREWDLIPERVACIRYGRPEADYQRLVDGYGFDPRRWDGWPALRLARELRVLTTALPLLASSRAVAAEFHRRMAGLRGGLRDERWTPYRMVG
jgi:Ser/Thr protein kinase RdoA (MazF antagonist)